MMFKLVLKCLAYLHGQLIKVQAQRAKDIIRANEVITAETVKINNFSNEQDKAAKIEALLKGVVS